MALIWIRMMYAYKPMPWMKGKYNERVMQLDQELLYHATPDDDISTLTASAITDVAIESWCCAANGLQLGTLVLQGNGAMPYLGSDLSPLTLSVQNVDQSILRVKIGVPERWEVPQDRLFINTAQGMLEDLQRFL